VPVKANAIVWSNLFNHAGRNRIVKGKVLVKSFADAIGREEGSLGLRGSKLYV